MGMDHVTIEGRYTILIRLEGKRSREMKGKDGEMRVSNASGIKTIIGTILQGNGNYENPMPLSNGD